MLSISPYALLNSSNVFTKTNSFSATSGTVSIAGSLRKAGLVSQGQGSCNFDNFYKTNTKFVGCKAWVKFNTVTSTSITASFNITSLTDNGVGNTTIIIGTDFDNADYFVAVGGAEGNTTNQATVCTGSQSAGSIQILTRAVNNNTLIDLPEVHVAMIGDT